MRPSTSLRASCQARSLPAGPRLLPFGRSFAKEAWKRREGLRAALSPEHFPRATLDLRLCVLSFSLSAIVFSCPLSCSSALLLPPPPCPPRLRLLLFVFSFFFVVPLLLSSFFKPCSSNFVCVYPCFAWTKFVLGVLIWVICAVPDFIDCTVLLVVVVCCALSVVFKALWIEIRRC